MYCFPGSVVQILWFLNKAYLNYDPYIYRFPASIVLSQDPHEKYESTFYCIENFKGNYSAHRSIFKTCTLRQMSI
jgi:hypothetical protein